MPHSLPLTLVKQLRLRIKTIVPKNNKQKNIMDEKKVIAYKGFDENLCCRGFQYEIGKEYVQEGEIACCRNGFHACTNPFDVLNHYEANGKNRYCEVEQYGTIKSIDDDSIQSSSKIKIKAEIGMSGLFKAGIEWILGETNPTSIIKETRDKNDNPHGKYDKKALISDSAKIYSVRNHAMIASNGNHAMMGLIGDFDQIGSSGDSAKIGSCGEYVQISSSGEYAQIGSNGEFAKISSSGEYAQIGSCGNAAKIGSSGRYAQIGSSGEFAKISSSGDVAHIGSSGDYAQIGSSGNYAHIGSSGNYAQIGSSGCSDTIDSTGEYSVIYCAGNDSMVKAKKGSWITLTEWKFSEDKKRGIPVCVKTEYVDGERIKEDTWYKLVDGEFKEQ